MGSIKRFWVGVLGLITLVFAWSGKAAGDEPGPDSKQERLAEGKDLFTREWLPGDRRSFAGNGPGPVHNARSCVSCHYQGAIGGAGSNGSNSTIVSAFVTLDLPIRSMRGIPVENEPNPKVPYKQPDRAKLAAIHPALRTEASFIWHRFSNDRGLETWKPNLIKNAEPSFFHPASL